MPKKVILNANVAFVLYNFRYGLMKALDRNGYEVICVAQSDKSKPKIEENGWKFVAVSLDRRGKNIINDLKLFLEYLKIFRKEKPDYILNFTIKPNIYGAMAAKILGIPTINNVTGLGDMFDGGKCNSKIVSLLYKIAFRFPKRIFFQNNDDMNIFLNNGLVKKEKCVRVPGSGVDTTKFVPVEKKNIDDKIRFLFLGRISNKKGVRIINEVSKLLTPKYPNIEFQLLGKIYTDEDEHISLEEIKEWEKQSNIRYLGTSSDVRNEISQADCIIFPSFYREGVPRSLIESAAMGKSILTTDNVGCRDIVEDGYNGYLAEPKSVESMLEIVDKFLNLSKDQQKRLGENGRKKAVEQFDERIVIESYLNEIIGRKRNDKLQKNY